MVNVGFRLAQPNLLVKRLAIMPACLSCGKVLKCSQFSNVSGYKIFFCDVWKICLTHDQYIIPEGLMTPRCGGCLITIMKTSNGAMKNGLSRSTVSFVLSLERLSGII